MQGVVVSSGLHVGLIVAAVIAASMKPAAEPIEIVTVAVLVEDPSPGPAGGAAPAPPPRVKAREPEPEPPQPEPEPPRVEPKPTPPPPKPQEEKQRQPKPPEPQLQPAARSGTPDPGPAGEAEPAAETEAALPDTATGTTAGGIGISAGPAAGSGAPTIDSAAFPFPYYRSIVTNRLNASWNRPVMPGLRVPIRVTVHFEILRTGAIAEVAHVSESGVAQLDRSALRAVYDANPLPPLPEEFDGSRLSANYTFELTPE